MAGTIDMLGGSMPLSNSPDSPVQDGGGGGTIEMLGSQIPLSHSPTSCVQKGGSASIDMVGVADLLSPSNVQRPYGAHSPSDKGE